MGINSITIEILEEYESSYLPPSQKVQKDPKVGWQQGVQNAQSKPDLTPILECLRVVDHRIYPAIKARLKNWYLYDGLGYEVMDYMFRQPCHEYDLMNIVIDDIVHLLSISRLCSM